MKNSLVTIGLTGVLANSLAMVSGIEPAQACHSTDNRIGVADFSNCQTFSIMGGPPSESVIAAHKKHQAAQLTVAIADYTQTLTTNIAQRQVQRTLIVHKLKMGELALSNIAVDSGNIIAMAEVPRTAQVTRGK